MKKLVTLALVAGAALASISPAAARDGCGRGAHRGPYGHCRPDRGREVIAVGPSRLVIGSYYNGRGYWDGRQYYRHRERFNNGWRYR